MNILMLTNIYPHPDETTKNRTKVIAYFTREWVKMGHRVVVVINSNKFPFVFRKLGKLFSNQIFSTKYLEIPDDFWGTQFSYFDEGVEVINIPINKTLPGGNFSHSIISNQIDKINNVLSEIDFIPDVITGHWIKPQLSIIAGLGKIYTNARTAFVFHGDYQESVYKSSGAETYLKKIDSIGFRSQSALKIASNYMPLHNSFVCSSGVPKEYVEVASKSQNNCLRTNKMNIVSAGRLVKSKHIDCIIDAYKIVIGQLNIVDHLFIAGEGPLFDSLTQKVIDYKLTNRVKLLGRIPRESLQEIMRESRIFALISENETFGLVYMEAMLQGCIVIASKFGGLDGIIKHGENGFLCEQGNTDELVDILTYINQMSIEERDMISVNAKKTACLYTDEKVAMDYLTSII